MHLRARRRLWSIVALALVAVLGGGAVAVAHQSIFPGRDSGRIGPRYSMTANGRLLRPAGRTTRVGDFPTGGTLSPDGRFYWVVDSGHGQDAVQIVRVKTGRVVQTLPLAGGYGGAAFAPDGRTAYVSGEPQGSTKPLGPVTAPKGDAIHVYSVDARTGRATEQTPITLPHYSPGNDQSAGTKEDWPEGLAVSPDGFSLVVALNQVDRVDLIDLRTHLIRSVSVGEFPSWVAISPDSRTAYASNEYSGTVSKISLASGRLTATIPVGGPGRNTDGQADPNKNAHPESLVVDNSGRHVYVPVANRDLVATIDTADDHVSYTSVKPGRVLGAEPVSVALSPVGHRLYVADENEDDVAVLDTRRHRVLGEIPTAAFPTAVAVTPRRKLVWVSGKGLGSGPNPTYPTNFAGSGAAPYGSYVLDMLLGRVGILHEPGRAALARMTRAAARQAVPANEQLPPASTPLRPNGPIKHVFYIIRENRTYDQIFGSEGARGDGDPALEVADDNGVSGPTGGITPNEHAFVREFPLLDHLYADSDVSQDGHQITDAGIAQDFVQRDMHPNYSGRGRAISNDNSPVATPPRDYIFDQAIRQRISFRNYGEYGAKTVVDDGRPTFAASVAGKDPNYPGAFGCNALPINATNCATDHGTIGTGAAETASNSRFDHFENQFEAQVAHHSVPALNVLIMPNDHTNGTKPGFPTPQALIADNDYGLGQFVQTISHSPIWRSSAIFIVEDDAQDGADHIDSHRMPAFAISPWVKHDRVIPTRYDQDSVLRSMELILGMKPLGLDDAVATPMYDAFTSHPDYQVFNAIKPDYPLDAVNATNAPDAKLSEAMPWSTPDAVPESISDQTLWQAVHGAGSTPPPPGPNASDDEEARAVTAMSAYRAHRSVGRALQRTGTYLDGRP